MLTQFRDPAPKKSEPTPEVEEKPKPKADAKCCCCARGVRLKEQAEAKIDPLFGQAGLGRTFTVNFETEWVEGIKDAAKDEKANDCTMQWNERFTKPLAWTAKERAQLQKEVKRIHMKDVVIKNLPLREWHNMHDIFWYLEMFKPWRDKERKKPCPDKETVPITDTPGIWGGRKGTNIIQYELILKSSDNCECGGDDEKSLYLEFFVKVDGKNDMSKLSELDKKPDKIPQLKY